MSHDFGRCEAHNAQGLTDQSITCPLSSRQRADQTVSVSSLEPTYWTPRYPDQAHMWTYIAQRIFLAVPVLFGISLIVFLALRLAPGDPAMALAGLEASNEELLTAIRQEHGLDRPWPEQYVRFLNALVRLDFGTSTLTRVSVGEEIASRLPTTIALAASATILASIVGITLGVLAARFQRTWLDYLLMVIAMVALSIPNYVIGLVFILVFAVTLGILPATGASSPAHFVMPVTTIGLIGAGVIARQTRSAMLNVLAEDYVRTARAKGLGERRVLYGHALRNALMPVVTVIGLMFGALLGGTVIVESIFSIPGIGKYMIDRIASRDYPAVQAAVIVIALSYVFVNILVDLSYVIIDKRVRLR
jgi:peptide/nickel transport system permease protein